MRDPYEVVQEYLRLLAAGEVDALDGVVAPDVLVYRPDGEVAFDDLPTWKMSLANEPFIDTEITVEDMVCEGEKVVVRYRVRCVQARPVLGAFAEHRSISTSGTKIYRVRSGKIAEIAGHDDVLGVLRQLGLVDIEM